MIGKTVTFTNEYDRPGNLIPGQEYSDIEVGRGTVVGVTTTSERHRDGIFHRAAVVVVEETTHKVITIPLDGDWIITVVE